MMILVKKTNNNKKVAVKEIAASVFVGVLIAVTLFAASLSVVLMVMLSIV